MSSSDGKPQRLGINLPPVIERSEVLQQQAATPDGAIRDGLSAEMPPVIRSVLELSHLLISGHSHWLRAAPGFQGGLFHQGSPYCFAGGYRDNDRPRELEERGNHMKLKDPLVYGALTLPITAAYLCELHGREIIDLTKPLLHYLPEMEGILPPTVTPRSVLAFTDVLDERRLVAQMCGSRFAVARTRTAWNACGAAQRRLFRPIEQFLQGGNPSASSSILTGAQQRQNFFLHLCCTPQRSASKVQFLRVSPHKARPSHFTMALLLHAVDRQLQQAPASADVKSCYEDSIRHIFFERAESHGAGFGAPKLWRSPQELFYQPTGLARLHSGFRRPITSGAPENCSPAIFNGSMNLYAPSEDYGKLLMLSLDTIRDAQRLLGPLEGTEDTKRPYSDFGIRVVPKKKELQQVPALLRGSLDWVPSCASFRYQYEYDLGCFGTASCGSRSARLFAMNLTRLIQHLYVKYALNSSDAGTRIDPSHPPLPDKEKPTSPMERVLSDHHRTKYFRKLDHHTKF